MHDGIRWRSALWREAEADRRRCKKGGARLLPSRLKVCRRGLRNLCPKLRLGRNLAPPGLNALVSTTLSCAVRMTVFGHGVSNSEIDSGGGANTGANQMSPKAAGFDISPDELK